MAFLDYPQSASHDGVALRVIRPAGHTRPQTPARLRLRRAVPGGQPQRLETVLLEVHIRRQGARLAHRSVHRARQQSGRDEPEGSSRGDRRRAEGPQDRRRPDPATPRRQARRRDEERDHVRGGRARVLRQKFDSWAAAYADRWIGRMEKDLFPILGSLPVASIGAPLLLDALRRVEQRGAYDTAPDRGAGVHLRHPNRPLRDEPGAAFEGRIEAGAGEAHVGRVGAGRRRCTASRHRHLCRPPGHSPPSTRPT